jgi:hypothetical protein
MNSLGKMITQLAFQVGGKQFERFLTEKLSTTQFVNCHCPFQIDEVIRVLFISANSVLFRQAALKTNDVIEDVIRTALRKQSEFQRSDAFAELSKKLEHNKKYKQDLFFEFAMTTISAMSILFNQPLITLCSGHLKVQ